LVDWAKKQYTRDDEPIIFCINQDTNTDNEVYYRAVRRSTGAPAYFAGAGAGVRKLRQTKLGKVISYFNELLVMEKLN
jgi:hypothetical protein